MDSIGFLHKSDQAITNTAGQKKVQKNTLSLNMIF